MNHKINIPESINLEGGEHGVLLIHGLQGNPLEMQYPAKRLHQAGFSVRVPHIRGYGFRPGDTAHSVTSWQTWRDELRAELVAMQQKHETVFVGGLCIGAVLALTLASEKNSGIRGLSLLSTTLFYDGWSIPWYRIFLPLGYYTPFRYLYSYREREPYGLKNEHIRKWVAREMANTSSSIAGASQLTLPAVHEAELMMKEVRRTLATITIPALLIHAAEDDVSSLRSADFVAANIGADVVEKIILNNSYHMITIDNERDRVANETIRFFQSLSWDSNGENREQHGTFSKN